jgi:uncharacterized membrane protein (DUF106 family)
MLIAILSALGLVSLVIVKLLLSRSGVRYLVDSYGLDRKKLAKLNTKEIAELKKSINLLRKKNDPFALEELIRKWK